MVLQWANCRGAAPRREARRVGHPGWGSRDSVKTKNRGNEAKKWLKTKHITFFRDANYARLACKFAQIWREKEQKQRILHNRNNHLSRPATQDRDTMSATLRGPETAKPGAEALHDKGFRRAFRWRAHVVFFRDVADPVW